MLIKKANIGNNFNCLCFLTASPGNIGLLRSIIREGVKKCLFNGQVDRKRGGQPP